MGITGPVHDVDLYVNLGRLVAIVAQEDKSGAIMGQLANFGLDNVGGFALSAAVGRNRPSATSAASPSRAESMRARSSSESRPALCSTRA